MHRKFFAIGLSLSFILTGAFLGWQQLTLQLERRAALEDREISVADESHSETETNEMEEMEGADLQALGEPEASEGDLSETSENDGSETSGGDGSEGSAAAATDSVSERLAALEKAREDTVSSEENADSTEEAADSDSTRRIKNRLDFTTVDQSYFTDALMVGDSRMVGIKEYSGLKEPTYFAYTGLTTFSLYDKELEVKNVGKTNFEDLISNHKFGKVYIMLGINEAGSKLSDYERELDAIVADVSQKQPDALIFLMANLHVTKYKSQTDKTYSNAHIDEINACLDKIAAKYCAYYIDANFLFDDGEGNLSKDCAADYAHLKGWCYPQWVEFLCSKGIVYDMENGESSL